MNLLNDLSIRTKLLAKSALIISLIIIMSTVVYQNAGAAQERDALVNRTYNIMTNVNEAEIQLRQMQASYREFLRTGQGLAELVAGEEQTLAGHASRAMEFRLLWIGAIDGWCRVTPAFAAASPAFHQRQQPSFADAR